MCSNLDIFPGAEYLTKHTSTMARHIPSKLDLKIQVASSCERGQAICVMYAREKEKDSSMKVIWPD